MSKSKFYLVKCKCNSEMRIFSHTTHQIKCTSCNEVLAETTGGHAVILGSIVKELDK